MALIPRATDEEKVHVWNDRMQLQVISNPKHNTSTLLYLFGMQTKFQWQPIPNLLTVQKVQPKAGFIASFSFVGD